MGQVIVTYTVGQTYTLGGTIADTNNIPVPGVTIQATGGFISTSAGDGTFSIIGVPAGATGITLTPSLAQYTFSPEQIIVPGPVNANVGDLNFTGSLVTQTYSISGSITYGSDPLEGVAVVASGGHEQTVATNASGEYTLSGIPHGVNLTITPSLTNYDFVPFSIQVNNLTGTINNQDFVAFSQNDRVISGTILRDSSGDPLEGVAVTANVNGVNQTFFTNHMGVYQVTGMGTGSQTITITPSLSGFSFSPAQRTIDYHHNNPQVTGQDFLAISLSGSFYSRQSGNWNQPATWSRTGHAGAAASRAPEAEDQVFVSASHTVSLTQNIIHNATITVSNFGVLVAGQHIVSGGGTFSLASDGVLQIGAAGGISQSGASGNIQTTGRNFSGDAHYVYNGTQAQSTGNALPETIASLTIDNPSGVTAVSSHRVTGLLDLQSGTLTMPVGGSMAAAQTVSSGGDLRMRTSFQGGKGWRLVTSPVQTTYSDMFSGGFVTQGFAGSSNPGGQPNLLYFDETDIGTTNQAWRTLSSLGQGTFGGRGYFYYVFAGDGGYSDNLPMEMSATGIEHAAGSGPFSFQATYTPRTAGVVDNTEVMELNAGWNLVGNPSSATIDWSNEGGWTKSNIATPVYIWSPASGNYITWNGITGSGTTKIAPFQAFWVQATGSNPVLQMNSGAKGLGGTFAQKGSADQLSDLRINTPVLHIELHADTLYAFSHLSFMPDGQFGEDSRDAYRLEPLSETFLKLYTTSSMHNKPLVINNLPDELSEPIQVPLYVGGQHEGIPVTGSYTLNWYNSGMWPEHWTVTLMDHQLEKAISMTRHNTYEFNLTGTGKSAQAGKNTSVRSGAAKSTAGVRSVAGKNTAVGKSIVGKGESADRAEEPQQFRLPQNIIAIHDPAVNDPTSVLDPVAKASTATPRFTIVIKPYSTEEEEPEYIANEARMMPPYPNPFDHQTTIRFSLPEAAHVTVEVFDIQGRRVALLADQQFESGTTTLPWSPSRLSGGIYIAVMRTEGRVETQKISLIR
jgi:hypothetical protein